jgi:hypothetical protein
MRDQFRNDETWFVDAYHAAKTRLLPLGMPELGIDRLSNSTTTLLILFQDFNVDVACDNG